jgi:uncharacterized iron-regulated membrane protein
MSARTLRAWAWVHRWSSLVCTAFLLVLCVTGLPLLFADQIEAVLSPQAPYAKLAAGAGRASLDPMVATARRLRPREVVTGIYLDPEAPQVVVHTAISHAAANASPSNLHDLTFDARTGTLLGDSTRAPIQANRVNQFIFDLHSKLLLGAPGLLIMGSMGALFVVAIVSGVVLYAPFMRRLDFGTVRRDRSARTRRLDTHNLFGAVILAWTLVVGATGVLNELNEPLFARWSHDVVAQAAARGGGQAMPPGARLSSVQAALETARGAAPGMTFTGIDYPGGALNSQRHYMLWARGATPATAQLFTPVMVDARDGRLTAVLPMPWYLRAIEISRPFHFGDYGGLPLRLIWALFDLATIVVLVTGLQLWLRPAKGGLR